ncbi:MAG TPA: GTP pyrophosphokinase family protein [Bacillus bacterium]|uniref:GTP pyrophosphokinase n=1 Tax=Siminovitchia fordii TaxID=254759 RepID=A0ABQ4K195_9BACI|nr:GTP pyrophosphokinase family protein [Siminovitchia fordii]GIN19497.1 GTP pyrophosphokinase [Siminovitchia fordii]HBZ11633.1 GTP pyrophosphokinase family protein [Bacillus sp. (in: firmicutes)]
MASIASKELDNVKNLKDSLVRFMMTYKFALDEVNTKINILKQEFQYADDYNPIEHVTSRLKSPESIISKAYRKGFGLTLSAIKENIRDIAGIRITCSFISDIYKISRMLQSQKDITLIETKDYVKNPKPNGYRSVHLIIQIPVFMSDRVDHVFVEVQIRTIAMDFWASLEHKIYYKYDGEIPSELKEELTEAAFTALKLDEKMEKIHDQVNKIKEHNQFESSLPFDGRFQITEEILKEIKNEE